MSAQTTDRRIDAPPATRVRTFAALVGLTSLAIFIQAVLAGQFVSQDGKDSWITVHGVVADVSWAFALITAAFALLTLRRALPSLTAWSVVLFVLTLAQTGIGHLITDNGDDALIGLHVPLALVIFGLTIWLSMQAARVARASDAGSA